MSTSKLTWAICAGLGSTIASLASAQTTSTAPAEDLTEIVITGSRIVRNGNNAPTPVTVATVDQLEVATPSNIPDALNKLPAFNSSRSVATLGNGANPNQGNYLNLRAFGFNRTLILMDGRRVPGTTFTGDVNTDMLPQMLVQRVDVVTGGASAVYGSDAVTGVVNYILDDKFQGMKAVAQYGLSELSDDQTWRLGVAGGTAVGERGHVVFSAEHFDRQGIPSKFDRPYGAGIYQLAGAGTAASPFHTIVNGRLSSTSFGGRIIQPAASTGIVLPSSLLNMQFGPGSVLIPFDAGIATDTANLSSGGDGGYIRGSGKWAGNAAIAPLVSSQVFGRFQYELGDNVTGFVQANWAKSRNAYHGQNEFRPYNNPNSINIYSGNAYLPANVQTIMTTNNIPYFGLGRYMDEFGNRIFLDATNTSVMATVGLEGKLADDWNWDVFYTRGEGKVYYISHDNVNNPRFYAAIDAVRDSSGNIICRVSQTNPGLYPGCVPMNILGDGSPSEASIQYVLGDTWWQAKNTMDDLGGNLTGNLGSTWAGPISVATGFEYRKNKLDETTSDEPTTPFVSTGLRGPFTSGTQNWTRNVVASTFGKQNVKEVNAEAVLPLLADKPFAKTFELNGAARYTDYSNSGSVNTWKVGINYQPTADFRVRATRSRDIRAPSVYELYQATSLSITGFGDLHTGASGSTNTSTGGNPDLVPEKADTTTVGIVYTPNQVPGLSLSVDYYDIRIDNAIAGVGGNNAAVQRECENSNGTSPLCALYVRPFAFSDRSAANYPTLIITQSLNIAQTNTHGIDAEIGYRTELPKGAMDLRLLASYQPVLNSRTLPSSPVVNGAGAASNGPGSPAIQKTRLTLNATYSLKPFAINTQIRYLSGLVPGQVTAGSVYNPQTDPDIPSYIYVDLAGTYEINSGGYTFTPFLTINNLFDKQPPLYASSAFTGNPGFFYPVPTGYDIVGRYYTVGMRFKF